MSYRPDQRYRTSHVVASQSVGRSVAVSLLLALAMPAAILLVSEPVLALGFVAGLVVARGRTVVTSALGAAHQLSTGVRSRRGRPTE